MVYSNETKLDIKFYDQVWSSMDLNPNRLTSVINKMFIYNETETKRHNYSNNYFDYDKQYVQSSGSSESAGLNILGIGALGGSGSSSSSSENQLSTTTQSIFSATEIQHAISQQQIDIQWLGEKLIPKSFSVYKMTDITDYLQTAIIAKQMIADKANGAIFRTVSTIIPTVSTDSRLTTFTGEIKLYTGDVASIPELWLLCNGAVLSRTEYQRLFSVIGITYGAGDGSTTFNLPDFRGRFPIGVDELQIRVGEATKLGMAGGNATHQLTVAELPAHTHDQGKLVISGSGTHSHTYSDPGHNHGGSTGAAAPEHGGGRGTVNGGGIHDRGLHVHTIATDTTHISIDAAGDHIHEIVGETGSIGSGAEFGIINPFQTCHYMIYTG
ncbi:unnamed protein product [Didymodactylos carnosus]|uniref:Phage tail collar domain-containing protein n=1 Tax=Didymodactylos carnosus TaxID=1234261 RepID=A0A815QW73_9BILA|nr:unnamed protein product [Didymodactylos carnosus]CAF4337422.1 unnamed protein product [Didymodactylos carnosus]